MGETLIDQFPDYAHKGGAPFNFALRLKNFDLPVRLTTRVGSDAYGQRLLRMLSGQGFKIGDIQIDPHHRTGVVNVALDESGIPTFLIIPDVAYDYPQLDEIRHITDNPASPGTFVEYPMQFFYIEMLSITRGARGSMLITKERTIETQPAPSIVVVDTVGAGGRYAAMLAFGIHPGPPIETIASIATDSAGRICQLPGAVTEDAGFYDTWRTRYGEYL